MDEFENYEKVAKQTAYNPRFTVERCYVAGLEGFAYAGEVPDDSVGIAAAIQHGDHGCVVAMIKHLRLFYRGAVGKCARLW